MKIDLGLSPVSSVVLVSALPQIGAVLTSEGRDLNGIFGKKKDFNKIRDLFKVKLYTIISETKKREREKHMLTLALTRGS